MTATSTATRSVESNKETPAEFSARWVETARRSVERRGLTDSQRRTAQEIYARILRIVDAPDYVPSYKSGADIRVLANEVNDLIDSFVDRAWVASQLNKANKAVRQSGVMDDHHVQAQRLLTELLVVVYSEGFTADRDGRALVEDSVQEILEVVREAREASVREAKELMASSVSYNGVLLFNMSVERVMDLLPKLREQQEADYVRSAAHNGNKAAAKRKADKRARKSRTDGSAWRTQKV